MAAASDVWLCNQVMPSGHRDLGGDQGGFSPIAFLDDFEQVEALLVGEAVGPEVIEDEQLDAGKLVDEAGKAAIEAGERQVLEQARHAHIEHGMIEPCRLPAEGAGQPRLAGAGRTGLIMPVIRMARQRRLSVTPFIRVRAGRFLSQAVSVIAVSRPMSGDNRMAAWR